MINYKNIDLNNYKNNYVAPLIGNGSISFQTDFEGSMQNIAQKDAIKNNPDMRIWLAGRRYMHTMSKELISYGLFEQSVSRGNKKQNLKKAQQALDVENAVMYSNCAYENDVCIKSQVFTHRDYNLIAVNKKITSSQKINYKFSYKLCSVEDKSILPEFTDTDFKKTDDGYDIFIHTPHRFLKIKV